MGGFLGECKCRFKLDGLKVMVYEELVFIVFGELCLLGDIMGLVD